MKHQIEIIDNFLPKNVFDDLQRIMLEYTFPWFLSPYSVYEDDGFPQFYHMIYCSFEPTSEYWDQIKNTIQYIKPNGLYRIKANATPIYSKILEKPFHIDQVEIDGSLAPHKVMILYINTNDGYTVFEDGTEVKSIENRAVFFDGKIKHAGTTCTDKPIRIVLNFNYI